MQYRQTKFSDVCGTMDEFKRLLYEEKEKVFTEPESHLEPLLEDALFMLARMEGRVKEYKDFVEEIRKCLQLVDEVKEVDSAKASRSAELIRKQILSRELEVEKLADAAESIRSVASELENRLRTYKDLALRFYVLFLKVKGDRNWLLEAKGLEKDLKSKYQAWLPPEPHRSKLLKWLVEARAYVIEPSRIGEQPLVQFEDGGLIPMSQVRWDPDIENFHPAGFKPSPSGRRYRRK